MMRPPSTLLLLLALSAPLLPLAPARSHVDLCSLPPERGPCLALFRRWYYSPRARRCQYFTYGGCKGNANNFRTWEECQRKCALRVPDGRCPAPFQGPDVICGDFCSTDTSCPGSELCCKMACGQRCQLPLEAIHGYCPRVTLPPDRATICLASCTTDLNCGSGVGLPRKKCCNFGCRRLCLAAEDEHPGVCPIRTVVQTFAPCNDTCADDRDCPLSQKCCFTGCRRGCLDPVRSDRCQLPPKTGPCRGQIERYYYSPSQKKCLQFIYGGCDGNSNNFETQKACEEACGKISPEVCKLPSDSGPCLGLAEMYYFNSTTKTCDTFIYGLCGGNGNRFSTKLECSMVCRNRAKSPAQ